MKEHLTWILLSAACVVIGGLLILVGLLSNRKSLFRLGILLVLPGSLTITYLMIRDSRALFERAREAIKPRTGLEIYAALFEQPAPACVEVLHHRDQVIPKIDYAIWLELRTCPDEMRRLLSLRSYQHQFKETSSSPKRSTEPNWFDPLVLGDSAHYFRFEQDDYGNGTYLVLSKDSTHLFCKDIAD
ncbi:MAG: hypothetical protein H6606_05840 [Flavobacteriales bacterium]|nr:hypothetical protein [Flavobacteriales bacterium]